MAIDDRLFQNAFVCPYPSCSTKSHQDWFNGHAVSINRLNLKGSRIEYANNGIELRSSVKLSGGIYSVDAHKVPAILFSSCMTCRNTAVWLCGRLMFPAPMEFQPPADLPNECISDFREACAVAPHSARAGAALMRSCLEVLLKKVTGKSNPSDGIKKLVAEQRCDETIQQAMDYVRIAGNKALHESDAIPMLTDDTGEHFKTLVSLICYIVDDQITRPKKINGVFATLPQSERDRIDRRDGRSTD